MLFFVTQAVAQAPCTLLPNGCTATNMFPAMLGIIATILANTIAGACVLAVVWGGVNMGISTGDDSRISKGRDSIIYGMIGLVLSLLSQSLVYFVIGAATSVRGDNIIISGINFAIDTLVYFFNIAIFVVIFYGGITYIISRGNADQANKGTKMVTWALIGGLAVNAARLVAEFVLSLGL
jgi:hypothetical protein